MALHDGVLTTDNLMTRISGPATLSVRFVTKKPRNSGSYLSEL
jgi:hypothetical protein